MKTLCSLVILAILNLNPVQETELPEKLNSLAESYKEVYGFSGTIKVIRNDEPVFEESYGLANREFNIKNEPDTRFSINSISKTFTAVAVLKLVQEVNIDLAQPISSYLPDLEANWKDSLTVHHLLTHTSGLPRESGIQAHQELDFRQQLRLVEKQELLFEPGERYEYSNAGLILLGNILENVTGLEYQEVIKQKIIAPLGLSNTGYYEGRNVVKKLAVPYRLSANGLEFAQRSKHYGANAGGGLYSTVSDLYEFTIALEDHEILNEEFTDLMFYPHVQSGESDFEGYAWSIKNFGNEKIHFAAGSGYGTKSVIIRIPETGDFIGVTSNWGNTPILDLLRDLYLTLKGAEVTLPSKNLLADPSVFEDKLGAYSFNEKELTRHIGIKRSRLKLHQFEGRLFLDDELLAARDGVLKLTYTDELQIEFEDDKMIIEVNGNVLEGKKLTNEKP